MKVTTNRKVTKQDRKSKTWKHLTCKFQTVCQPLYISKTCNNSFYERTTKGKREEDWKGTRKSPRNSTKKVVAFNSFIVVTFDRSIYTVSEVSCSHTTKNIKVCQQSCYRHSDCSNSKLWIKPFCY